MRVASRKEITTAYLLSLVDKEEYHICISSLLTSCTITLINGAIITGEDCINKTHAKNRVMCKLQEMEEYLIRDKFSKVSGIGEIPDTDKIYHLGSKPKLCLGSKVVYAVSMAKSSYELMVDGVSILSDEEDGYLIRYINVNQPNLIGFNDYVTWLSKTEFDRDFVELVGTPVCTYKSELLREQIELNIKITKLSGFLGSENFSKLSNDYRALVYSQHDLMHKYLTVLNKRLNLLEVKEH